MTRPLENQRLYGGCVGGRNTEDGFNVWFLWKQKLISCLSQCLSLSFCLFLRRNIVFPLCFCLRLNSLVSLQGNREKERREMEDCQTVLGVYCIALAVCYFVTWYRSQGMGIKGICNVIVSYVA